MRYVIDNKLFTEGKRIISALEIAEIEIDAAFWWYSSEEDRWLLIIATPIVKSTGHRAAYQRVFEVIRDNVKPEVKSIGRLDISLVEKTNPIVRIVSVNVWCLEIITNGIYAYRLP